jgi:uncharacterized protein (DUF952 family)
MLIYKIVKPDEWEEAEKVGIYYGSEHDNRDGFLHFSTAAQLLETLRLHYAGIWAVVIAAVDASALGGALKFEHSAGRNQDFPHLHGPLELVFHPPEKATIVSTIAITPSSDDDMELLRKWLDDLSATQDSNVPL